jgi:hypothetical protein
VERARKFVNVGGVKNGREGVWSERKASHSSAFAHQRPPHS